MEKQVDKQKIVKAISTFNRFENENIHENQLFLGRNTTKKLDFVLFLEKSCIPCVDHYVTDWDFG